MVWSNYPNIWLTALLLIGAVLPLVRGMYYTCPTTKQKDHLYKKTDLQNADSYKERRCIVGKCCLSKGRDVSMYSRDVSVEINVRCLLDCPIPWLDCSLAEHRCRNVADIIDFYKGPDFVSCPLYKEFSLSNRTNFTNNITEVLCPTPYDKCSLGKFRVRTERHGPHNYFYMNCMSVCAAKVESNPWRIITPCTPCSGTEDCKLKINKVISHPTCPTTKEAILYTKEAIEAESSYEEKICYGSDECCAEKTTVGQLTIEVKCSASCVRPEIDCSWYKSNCTSIWDITTNFYAKSDYVSCMSLYESSAEWKDEVISNFDNFTMVLCPKTETCSVARVDHYRNQELSNSEAFAGCMKDCKKFVLRHRHPNTCIACSNTNDCRKILQDRFNDTIRAIS